MEEDERGDPFRLDFEVVDPSRLPALRRLFDALKREKAAQFGAGADEVERGPDDPGWLDYLDDGARLHFKRALPLDGEEARTYRQLWDLTDPALRNDPMFTLPGPWDFESILESICNCEYLFVEISAVVQGKATLRYDPLAGPFGGTESLVQLVEAFGQKVTFDSWNEGAPFRPEAGWDYERAKQLVRDGRGASRGRSPGHLDASIVK